MKKIANALFGSALLCIAALGFSAPASAYQYTGQCAPFARMISGIELFGNAHTWWAQAEGRYDRGHTPRVGSVMVLKAFRSMRVGHVAMVSQVVDARTIRVTHANWSVINGRRGQVEENVLAVDASPDNDWSEVRIWYAPMHDVGLTAYPVACFIYNSPTQAEPVLTYASAGQARPLVLNAPSTLR
jgi:surface antigen